MVDYAPGSRSDDADLGVPVSEPADGFYGVAPGQSYDLIVSLQRQETNPVGSRSGKTITVVDGAGKGQTAMINGYNPETNTFTIRSPADGHRPASRFEISRPHRPVTATRRRPTATRSC